MSAETPEAITEAELARLREGARTLGRIVVGNHRAMEAARIEMRQNGPHAAMQWILNSLPDVWDDDETAWDGQESAEAWFDRTEAFYRASQIDAAASGEAGASTHPPEVVPTPDGNARERTGGVEALPVAAAFDREAAREIARMAIGRYWNHDPLGTDDHPAAERVTEAFWPLLERAQQAAAGSHEGIRLWMLDCGELVAKHRDRAVAAEAKVLEYESALTSHTDCTRCAGFLDRARGAEERAERAEGKLAGARGSAEAWAALAPPDEWGESMADTIKSDCGRAILAIIGSEEKGN
jgi:hypothetical protein